MQATTERIKPLTKTEVAQLYNISLYRLRKWLKPHKHSIGEYVGGIFTINQIKIIFEKLGEP